MARGPLRGDLRDLGVLFESGAVGGLADTELLARFTARRDGAAFAALVARHGRTVLSACRGVLRHEQDVEDAFQATFLILARKADTLARGESLGGWLHRVAHRVAVRAAVDSSRRRSREEKAAVPEAQTAPGSRPWDDVLPMLHEELARLPEKYRAPVVLCELEELTRDQAAGVLGWPPGTVAGRLARGRDLLRARLSRRGVAPTAVIAALAAAREAGAAVPAAWTTAAFATATGVAAARSVESLAKEVLKNMLRSKIRRIAATCLTVGVAVTALAVALAWAQDKETKDGPTVPVTGLVVDPDGRPAAGVAVFAATPSSANGWARVVVEARTDAEGHFRLTIPSALFGSSPRHRAIWVYRSGSLVASYPLQPENIHADVPLRFALGPPAASQIEVRDPQGHPVAGATVTLRGINRDDLSIPDGLAERIAANMITDARGRATVSAFLSEEIRTLQITARGFGTQQFGFGIQLPRVDNHTKVVNLMPAGRVEGRVVGRPGAVRGFPLTVAVWNATTKPPRRRPWDCFT